MFFSRSRITVYSIILGLVILFFIFSRFADDKIPYDRYYPDMHRLIFNVTEVNITEYENSLPAIYTASTDKFAKGDISLVKARLSKDQDSYKEACELFIQYEEADDEESAIRYETLASLNCFNERRRWLQKAVDLWEALNVTWRSRLLSAIMHEENLSSVIVFDDSTPGPRLDLTNSSTMMIGNSSLLIRAGMKMISQEDRVYRDWLSLQLNGNPFKSQLLNVFSERFTYDAEELRADIGWHEGGEVMDIQSKVNITHFTAVGTISARNPGDGKWYAPSADGVFRFEVLPDKIYYPTTRFISSDVAMLIDTHGISSLVEQAVRKHADIAIGCCDSAGKIKAALYLSDMNISVICLTDRFSYLALGDDSRIIGSARLSSSDANDSAVMSGTTIFIHRNETVVVSNINPGNEYPMFYYATPYYYFSQINKTFRLRIVDVKLTQYNETEKVFQTARTQNATVVGFRIYNSYDYSVAKKWLMLSDANKLVLFHSMSYPYGKLLADEFSDQISFGDVNPVGLP